jgi:hypothetical protein
MKSREHDSHFGRSAPFPLRARAFLGLSFQGAKSMSKDKW